MKKIEKIDYKKEYKHLYTAKDKPVIVDVPEFNFIMFDGKGHPDNSPDFMTAIEALYSTAYTTKFMLKGKKKDFTVMPLEGLWWFDNDDFSKNENWSWTLMISLPDFVKQADIKDTKKSIEGKKDVAGLDRLYFTQLKEGKCAQILHVGPYSKEGPTLEKLHGFIKDEGYTIRGKHHEIYLSDPRRTAPEKVKTILRHSVK